jgi:hypothetical protein
MPILTRHFKKHLKIDHTIASPVARPEKSSRIAHISRFFSADLYIKSGSCGFDQEEEGKDEAKSLTIWLGSLR